MTDHEENKMNTSEGHQLQVPAYIGKLRELARYYGAGSNEAVTAAQEQIDYGRRLLGQALLGQEGSESRHEQLLLARNALLEVYGSFVLGRKPLKLGWNDKVAALTTLGDLYALSGETFGETFRSKSIPALRLAQHYYVNAYKAASGGGAVARVTACVAAQHGMLSAGDVGKALHWKEEATRVLVPAFITAAFGNKDQLAAARDEYQRSIDITVDTPEEVRAALVQSYTSLLTEE